MMLRYIYISWPSHIRANSAEDAVRRGQRQVEQVKLKMSMQMDDRTFQSSILETQVRHGQPLIWHLVWSTSAGHCNEGFCEVEFWNTTRTDRGPVVESQAHGGGYQSLQIHTTPHVILPPVQPSIFWPTANKGKTLHCTPRLMTHWLGQYPLGAAWMFVIDYAHV